MKKLFYVLPIVALAIFALPAVSYANSLNPGNTQSDPIPPESSNQGGGASSSEEGN
ncbi:MAG: hypothetical protein R3229_01960 [Alphaproteobacteria bacterium]|nr:hypothetical protein [Alphaproteobacteria bacterium]